MPRRRRSEVGHSASRSTMDPVASSLDPQSIEEALRVSEHRLRTAIAASPVAVFNQDLNLRYTWILNPTPGPYEGTVLGRTDREILERADDAEVLETVKRRVLKTGRGTRRQLEATVGGATRRFDITLEPLRSPRGDVIGLTGAAMDITEQSRMEEALREQTEALEEADRRKDEFIAMLAHELRSPLAPIRNALETLCHRRTRDDRPIEHELQVIDRQLGHLTLLVDDLLDVARITRGHVELRREPVAVETIVDLAVETVEPDLAERRQRLEISIPSEPLPVHGDRVRLAQVLSNLLSNASKYSAPGSSIELMAERADDQVLLRVRDHGIGMPPDRIARVFDHFFQMNSSLDRSGGGLGLGLTLVKVLTELHGGSVEARSDGPDRGSAFTVRLPLLPLARAPAHRTRSPGADREDRRGPVDRGDRSEPTEDASETSETPQRPGCRVLVVDDSVDTAESFAELLALKGYTVRAVHDGPSAIEACREFLPDVVFLDIGLPEMNGYEVAERLCHDVDHAPVLVAVTGYGQEESRSRARRAGIDHHVLKPIDLDRVLEILDQAG